MSKLPPRNILRCIVEDAISDREALNDSSIAEETAATIASYHRLKDNLGNASRPLDDADRKTLKIACLHARIWRESYLDAWIHTDDKPVILEARQDIDRITRTETALGGRYMTALEHALDSSEMVSIWDLKANDNFGGQKTG